MDYLKKTIGELFIENAQANGDEVFVVYEGISFTWKEIYILSRQLIEKVDMFCDLRAGDYVGIYAINSVDWLINFFALQMMGVKTVLFNPHHKYDTMLTMISKHKIKLVLYANSDDNSNFFKTIEDLKATDEIRCKFQNIKTSRQEKNEILSNFSLDSLDDFEVFSDYEETAVVIFTSGSTGLQKGVMLSHYSLLNNAKSTAMKMGWIMDDGICVSVPFFHCFGLTTCILTSLIIGFRLCIVEDVSTEFVSETIEKNSCTILNGVPTMFLAIVRKECYKCFDLSTLKSGVIAGSPIYASDYKEICDAFKGFKLQPSYGQSEASPCISLAALDDDFKCKSKTVGRAIDDVELRISDLETGEIINEGIGEIETRGYHVMKGYLNDEEQTREVLSDDGWLKTGDIGYVDEGGYLHIEGRKKNLIIRCGENISPVMIEKWIKKFDGELEVAVLGTKVDVLQEEVVACIINRKKEEDMLADLKKYLEEKLPWYAVPKYFLFFEEVKRTGVGKVDLKYLSKEVDKILAGEKSKKTHKKCGE